MVPKLKRYSSFGVPYGNRTRVAAVQEKRFTGIHRKSAAWIAREVVKLSVSNGNTGQPDGKKQA